MPLQYLIDENLRGTLAVVLVRTATRLGLAIEVSQVGDVDGPPLGSTDVEVIRWAEDHGFVIVSLDRRTLPIELAKHLAAGRRSPGVFFLRSEGVVELAEHLLLIAYASDPSEWQNQISYVP